MIIDSYLRKYKMRRKNEADMIYRLSQLISNGTAQVLGGKKVKPIEFLDIFEDIFPEEVKKKQDEKMELEKLNMMAWANSINRKFSRKEE